MWREACTITTVEELDALPSGVEVRSVNGPWLKNDRFYPDEPWWPAGGEISEASSEVGLPARLTHHPDWPQP
ncbi:hypothetical protein B1R94_02190 [Mycolicibacterium litorale]|nr:hypothetical protein B1R94_02190 [Mycolicibacterium litorale]